MKNKKETTVTSIADLQNDFIKAGGSIHQFVEALKDCPIITVPLPFEGMIKEEDIEIIKTHFGPLAELGKSIAAHQGEIRNAGFALLGKNLMGVIAVKKAPKRKR